MRVTIYTYTAGANRWRAEVVHHEAPGAETQLHATIPQLSRDLAQDAAETWVKANGHTRPRNRPQPGRQRRNP